MGLESLDLAIASLGAGDTQTLTTALSSQGWQEVNYGFNLGRNTGALDIHKGSERRIVYNATPQDNYSYLLLEKYNLPRFQRTQISGVAVPDAISVVSVPVQTRALDSLRFPEKDHKSGYLGAYEIMEGIAQLLARIYKDTSTTLGRVNLNNLALVAGEMDYIRLVPPLDLQPSNDLDQIANQLLSDLLRQDPDNDHAGQIAVFRQHFEYIIRYDP